MREGKDAAGITAMLIVDWRKQHKGAIGVMIETGFERASRTNFNFAAEMVIKQMTKE